MTISGLEFRIVRGKKTDNDLRLEVLANGWWRPVDMELAFMLVDFFTENEAHIQRSYWRWNGDSWFVKELASAWKQGWKVPAAKLRREQGL